MGLRHRPKVLTRGLIPLNRKRNEKTSQFIQARQWKGLMDDPFRSLGLVISKGV